MKHLYYKLMLKQMSPLRISTGDAEETDSDILKDKRGLPFIPGSSVAGVLRSMLDAGKARSIFGYIDGNIIKESSVKISDAVLADDTKEEDIRISTRDGVGLDEWGCAVKGSKYDFQIVECDKEYSAVIDCETEEDDTESVMDELFGKVIANDIRFGARTSRGFGLFKASVWKKSFSFPDEMAKWLAFDPFEAGAFENAEELKAVNSTEEFDRLDIAFHIDGTFNLRVKSTKYEVEDDGTKPDSVPLMDMKGRAVIPGTAWAGAVRHHMCKLAKENGLGEKIAGINAVFGKMPAGEDHKKSRICFSETVLEEGSFITVSRNALDRFTQAPRNGAVFTNKCLKGGRGSLEILIKKGSMEHISRQLLSAVLIDMDLGLMPVGGENGIGRGCLNIDAIKLNGKEITDKLKAGNTELLEVG